MPVTSACPDRNTLDKLIKASLPEAEMDRLTEHLENCDSCQARIQVLATGEIPIDDLMVNIGEVNPPSQSAYWEAVSAVQRDIPSGDNPTETSVRDTPLHTSALQDTNAEQRKIESSLDSELKFLQPAEDPAYLGKLDHFLVARVVGRGGMGIVLEAFDPHLQRSVAIKVLNPQFQENDIARQRFCREGRAAAAISHEHVVTMYQVAKTSESTVAYLVMQFIEGITLEERLREGQPLPPSEVARIGMQAAAGLSAAHSRRMVHRDIKPGNILIEAETNRVKLTDFGLARAADEVKLTRTGMVTGTPLYMSPEQAMGSEPDERSDLFSLGAVMYEMATGNSPFQAPSAVGVMKKVMDEQPTPPHRLNDTIGKPLSDLIMALLAKSPKDRPDSAAEVTKVLASVVNEFGPISPLQVPAVAASEVKRLSGSRRARKQRMKHGLIFGASLSLAVAAGALLMRSAITPQVNEDQSTNEPTFPSVVLEGNPGTVWSVDFAPDGKQLVAAIEDGTVRLWDIDAKQVVKSFNAHRGIVWMIKFHPDLDLVATSGDDGRVKLWKSDSFELVREWRAKNAVRGVAFSPDGKQIIAGDREGMIFVFDINSDEVVASHRQPGAIFGIDYSPNGKLIATVGSDKVVRLWDSKTLEQRQSLSGHDGPIYNVKFAENGTLLATVGWNENIRIWNVETGTEVQSLQGSEGDVWSAAFCGDSTHLVSGDQDGTAHIWQLSDGAITATLRGHEAAVHNIALNPLGCGVATSSRDGTIRVWDLSSLKK